MPSRDGTEIALINLKKNTKHLSKMKNLILILSLIAVAIAMCALIEGIAIGTFSTSHDKLLGLASIVWLMIAIALMYMWQLLDRRGERKAVDQIVIRSSAKAQWRKAYDLEVEQRVNKFKNDRHRKLCEYRLMLNESKAQRKAFEDSYQANPFEHSRMRLIHLQNIERDFLNLIRSEKQALAELKSN